MLCTKLHMQSGYAKSAISLATPTEQTSSNMDAVDGVCMNEVTIERHSSSMTSTGSDDRGIVKARSCKV